ncbi:MAG: hypothetical protein GY906_27685 [bacterium]|nr:hypothetical protein [bacterium]
MKQRQYQELKASGQIAMIAIVMLYATGVVVGFVGFPSLWYLWAFLLLAGLVWIVRWNLTGLAFRCPSCNEIFEITVRENLSGANLLTTKRLICKSCGHLGWAKVMRVKE